MKDWPGILIALEGIDGAGKTTQIGLLAKALQTVGESIVASKEPTDGFWGRKIRDSAKNGRMPISEELRAFIEDRKEHVKTTIMPSLLDGSIVVLDRYYYSTIAYQGARLDESVCDLAIEMQSLAPRPDLAIVLDVSPTIGLFRISASRGEIPNAFEREDTLNNVRQIFLELSTCEDEPIVVIDGHASIHDVHRSIIDIVINGPLKSKRCAKSYDCDMLYCSARLTDTCRWAILQRDLRSGFADFGLS